MDYHTPIESCRSALKHYGDTGNTTCIYCVSNPLRERERETQRERETHREIEKQRERHREREMFYFFCLTLGYLLAVLNRFEVDGGDGADQLHWLSLHQTGVLLVPASPFQIQPPDKHPVLRRGGKREEEGESCMTYNRLGFSSDHAV